MSAIISVFGSQNVSFVDKLKAEKNSGDFVAILQDAMKQRNNKQDYKDTFESHTSPGTKVSRDAHNDARKFDTVVASNVDDDEFRKVFHQFAGQTLYGQMLKAMRETQQKPAYFHGGRTEEIFQEQLDNVLVDKITEATPASFSDTMFSLMKQ